MKIDDVYPEWVPPAVAEMAELLRPEPFSEVLAKDFEVWSRLVFDPRMDALWGVLYKPKRIRSRATQEFLYPACLTNVSIAARIRQQISKIRKKGLGLTKWDARLLKSLEDEVAWMENEKDALADPRWNEQDKGARLFFYHAYHAALFRKVIFLSDLEAKTNELRDVAERSRNDADILNSFRIETEAHRLSEIADDCDRKAQNILPDRNPDGSKFIPGVDDPWIITRRRGDLELRTFLVDLSDPTVNIFGKRFCGTLATVSNVAFNRQDVTREQVREMLRR